MLARKRELGRKVPEREIAAYVATQTGKPSERALVGMWLHGEREPFVSQFLALCVKLQINPNEVLGVGWAEVESRPPRVTRHSGKERFAQRAVAGKVRRAA